MSFVTSVTGTAPIASSGGTTPNISMTTPLPVADGGTGAATLASSPYAVLSPSAPQSGELSITGGYSTSNGTGLAVGGVGLIYADGTNATIKLPSPGGNLFVQNHAGSGNAVQITDSGTVVVAGTIVGSSVLAPSGQSMSISSNASAAGGAVLVNSNAGTNNNGGIQVFDGGTMNSITVRPIGATTASILSGTTAAIQAAPAATGSLALASDASTRNATAFIRNGTAWIALGAATAGVFDIRAYGAKGDGTTDDSAAILAALAAATAYAASSNGSCLFFPPGHYYYNSATPLVIPIGVTVSSLGDSGVYGSAATTDCFQFSNTFAGDVGSLLVGTDKLPNIFGFANGWGIKITTNGRSINCAQIHLCKYACGASSTGGNGVLDNTVDVQIIAQCVHGVYNQGDASSGIQGNVFNVNFVTACQHALSFDVVAGSTVIGANLNNYNLLAIDCAGAPTPSYGIWSPADVTSGGYSVYCPNYFNGPLTGWTGISTPGHNTVSYILYTPQDFSYDSFGTPATYSSVKIVGTSPGGNYVSWNPLTTASNTRSSFIGGNAAYTNVLFLSATLSAGLTSGGFADFYGYSPILTTTSPIHVQLVTAQPVVVIAAEDESFVPGIDGNGPIPNQFHIRLYAIAAVPAGATVKMIAQIGVVN